MLLVEDDELVRSAARRLLMAEGYGVTAASSFDEAQACLRGVGGEQVGLLITDYHLGGNTGTEVVAVARGLFGADFKAILVTGDTSSEIRELHRDANLKITSKPIDAEELLALVQSLLNRATPGEP